MGKVAMDRSQSAPVDAILKDDLARGNRALRSVAPVIAHFLEGDAPNLVSDAIVARLRGMLSHIGEQLVSQGELKNHEATDSNAKSQLIDRLIGDEMVIEHLFSLALEWEITRGLEERISLDPVLSPLMQELIASQSPVVAELAMASMAAQSRFCQSQQRMELPLGELPHLVFARVIEHWEVVVAEPGSSGETAHIAELKAMFDEGAGRIGLLARLASAMRGGAIAGLDLAHAGLALFVSAGATLAGHDRGLAVFSCHAGQSVRLGLMLKAGGLSTQSIKQQIALLGGTKAIPGELERMSQAHALDFLQANVHSARRDIEGRLGEQTGDGR